LITNFIKNAEVLDKNQIVRRIVLPIGLSGRLSIPV